MTRTRLRNPIRKKMCTKHHADGDVHKYFNPYDSPYDAFINFMNVLDHIRTRIRHS